MKRIKNFKNTLFFKTLVGESLYKILRYIIISILFIKLSDTTFGESEYFLLIILLFESLLINSTKIVFQRELSRNNIENKNILYINIIDNICLTVCLFVCFYLINPYFTNLKNIILFKIFIIVNFSAIFQFYYVFFLKLEKPITIFIMNCLYFIIETTAIILFFSYDKFNSEARLNSMLLSYFLIVTFLLIYNFNGVNYVFDKNKYKAIFFQIIINAISWIVVGYDKVLIKKNFDIQIFSHYVFSILVTYAITFPFDHFIRIYKYKYFQKETAINRNLFYLLLFLYLIFSMLFILNCKVFLNYFVTNKNIDLIYIISVNYILIRFSLFVINIYNMIILKNNYYNRYVTFSYFIPAFFVITYNLFFSLNENPTSLIYLFYLSLSTQIFYLNYIKNENQKILYIFLIGSILLLIFISVSFIIKLYLLIISIIVTCVFIKSAFNNFNYKNA